jgi:hypothetical protein
MGVDCSYVFMLTVGNNKGQKYIGITSHKVGETSSH